MTSSGPVDVVLLRFPRTQFDGSIAPALRALVDRDVVRVLDVLFVYRDDDGTVGSLELGSLEPELAPAFVDVDGQLGGGLLDQDDITEVAGSLAPGTSIAVIAVENVWAIPFIDVIRAAGGELVDQTRVPAEVLEAVRQRAALS
jgi:hypothetical protein